MIINSAWVVADGEGASAGGRDAGDAGGAGCHAEGARGGGAARDRPLQGGVSESDDAAPRPAGRRLPQAREGAAGDPPRDPVPVGEVLPQVPRIRRTRTESLHAQPAGQIHLTGNCRVDDH